MNDRELSILKEIGGAVREQITDLKQQFEYSLKEQADFFTKEIEKLTAIVAALKDAPQPDIKGIVAEAVAATPAPVAPELPDVGALVESVVADAVAAIPPVVAPELPDIKGMVAEAVAAIPLPEAPELPDVGALVASAVTDAVAAIPPVVVPELPDVKSLVAEAVAAIPQPVSQELPDIEKMVTDAVAALPSVPVPEDGKDALQLEIQPAIDETKSYPRGTYATHSGGLWRAYQKTTGMKGWECVVDGMSAADIKQTEARTFEVSISMASGTVVNKSFCLPVMIYRGVFKNGEGYLPGDTVTWGGSLWHCDDVTTDRPGENGSKGWTLAAKRGRDGKS
ncbi:phage gp6-like head-tail connector protein [Serratia fonticola]|uniref:phage gp6-like head-tail connector protein n=1 Tax=Serratia fonticola TaxID=47917 RepID=UPI00192D04AA|nr:phage gp6-like head-tail connector protein [Serratia fonticola]MBL5825421.1 phage gp6-like head-tail connector protein [Serratia fonticola]